MLNRFLAPKTKTWLTVGLVSAVSTQALAVDKDLITILGGLIGGAATSNIGKGDGRIVAIAAGVIGGAIVAREVAEAMEERDRLAARNAYLESLNGPMNRPVQWNSRDYGGRSGAYGNTYCTREFTSQRGYYCRVHVTETWMNGRMYRHEATSCRYPDGSWQVYSEDQVVQTQPEPMPLPPPPPRHYPRDRYRPLPPPPAPTPSCQLLGWGPYQGMAWNFRIAADGRVWDAADDLYTVLAKLERIESQGICVRQNTSQCSLIGYGEYRGYYWNSRLLVDGDVIEASNEPRFLLQTMDMLRGNGICR